MYGNNRHSAKFLPLLDYTRTTDYGNDKIALCKLLIGLRIMLDRIGRVLDGALRNAIGRLEVVRAGASSEALWSRVWCASDVVLVDCQSDYDGDRG